MLTFVTITFSKTGHCLGTAFQTKSLTKFGDLIQIRSYSIGQTLNKVLV